jgi:hypothetical protein
LQLGLDVRRVSRQTVKIGERNRTRATRPLGMDDRVERREHHAHVRRMRGNAALLRVTPMPQIFSNPLRGPVESARYARSGA